MKDLYLDLISGISGDMFLGLLVDLGLDVQDLKRELENLPIPDFELTATPGMKEALGGTRVRVQVPDQEDHRHLPEIVEILEESSLNDEIVSRARAVFERLAVAEARVHRISMDEVHFHEVGALDAIVDVTGVVIGLQLLDIGRVICSPVPLGRGFTRSDHGALPLPAPAVLELLKGVPCRQLEIDAELTTPTGAALVTTLAESFGTMPLITLERVGYGLGERDLPIPNATRGMLGRFEDSGSDRVVVMETNIDDMNPEVYGYVTEKLFGAGALDVYLTPIQMKKGRPGVMLSALLPPGREPAVREVFFRETTTLGVRRLEMQRDVLPRRTIEVDTRWGRLRAKVAGRRVHPEYEDCARAARERAVPLDEVYEEVRRNASGTIHEV